jgi:hypothetical protein
MISYIRIKNKKMVNLKSFDPRPLIRSFNGTPVYRIIVLLIHIIVGIFYFYLTGLAINAINDKSPTFAVPTSTGIALGGVGVVMIIYHALSAWTRLTPAS